MRAAREAASARALGGRGRRCPCGCGDVEGVDRELEGARRQPCRELHPAGGALDELLAIGAVESDRNILDQGADGECGVGTQCFGMGAGASGGPARRYGDLAVLTTATVGFALGAGT